MLSDLSSYVKYQQLIWNILYSGTIFLVFLHWKEQICTQFFQLMIKSLTSVPWR